MTKARSNAVANAAKGDLTVGTGTNLSGILPVGADGESLVANSSTATGLSYAENYAAGKNKVLNSDFSIWQRGTSFSNLGFAGFACDRWQVAYNGNTTSTTSQQTFMPGAAPSAGYDGQFFLRSLLPVIGTTTAYQLLNTIEDVRTFNGQTATLSFFAKADSARTSSVGLEQNFGSGGSSSVQTAFQTFNLTTSFQRFTFTFNVPSISGKTIGASSFLRIIVAQVAASGSQLDLWGFQLEAGSVATAFQTATGSIQGELQACRRYLPAYFVNELAGYAFATNATIHSVNFDTPARVAPTGITSSGTFTAFALNTGFSVAIGFNLASVNGADIATSGITITAGQGSRLGGGGLILFTGCEL